MLPDHAIRTAMANALDHRGMVQLVRQDHTAGDFRGQRPKRGPVRHIARGEQQRRLFPVKIGQFTL